MKKTEWIEEHNKDLENYDKSILSHEDDYDNFMRNYEFSITNHDDKSYYGRDDWYESMGRFND